MGMAETAKSNLNTILMLCTLGLLGWVATTAQSTSVEVGKLSTALVSMTKEQDSVERELIELRTRVAACEIGLATLKVASGTK